MHNSVTVSNLSLVFAFALVMVSVGISLKEQLGLTKDVLWSVCRAIVQLVIVGYVLKFIFNINNTWLTILMTLFIIVNASWNAYKRDPNPHSHYWNSLVALLVGTYIVLGVLILSGAIKLIPSQIISITGMIASNGMVAMGLCYKTMNAAFHDQRQQVLEKLALGADVKLASQAILKRSIKTAMQPSIDSIKTVGLVSLPGMMSGLIFAGVDPVYAIRYQIMVSFMLLATTGFGAVISGYLSYRNYFNDRHQLVIE